MRRIFSICSPPPLLQGRASARGMSPQPFEINTLTGGSGKNRSIFSNCLSAVSVRYAVQSFKRMPIDCTIYSQIVSVPVVELGLGLLVVALVCGGGTCGELRPALPSAIVR